MASSLIIPADPVGATPLSAALLRFTWVAPAAFRFASDHPSRYLRMMFGTGARLFHWSIALLVTIQIPAGIAMTSEPLAAYADPLFVLHKGLGTVLLVLVLARVAWRVTHPPPPFPDHMPDHERRVAHATHLAIYAFLVVMVVSGYVRTVGDDYPIELMDALGIPTLLPNMPEVAAVMLVVHQFAVYGLVILVSAHVASVVQHHWMQGEPVLQRMWPPVRPKEVDDHDG